MYVLDREKLKERTKQFDKSENDLKALQSVGQIVGEVLKQLTEDKCKFRFISIVPTIVAIFSTITLFSHCEGNERTSVCCGLPSST